MRRNTYYTCIISGSINTYVGPRDGQVSYIYMYIVHACVRTHMYMYIIVPKQCLGDVRGESVCVCVRKREGKRGGTKKREGGGIGSVRYKRWTDRWHIIYVNL